MDNSKHDKTNEVKIEAGQIWNPEYFPLPNELVCIQVPKIFDQVSLRACETRTISLIPGSGVINPSYAFEGVDGFDITEIKVISKTDSLTKPGFKKLKLFVRMQYTIHYTDGTNQMTQLDEETFNLTISEIYCPNCVAQMGVVRYPEAADETIDKDGLLIKVEALPQAFNDEINATTGVLLLDIGVFFIVKCECEVQLLMPSYGYCPVPPEQSGPADLTCKLFNDKKKTPFPTSFFPKQKWNPLDKDN